MFSWLRLDSPSAIPAVRHTDYFCVAYSFNNTEAKWKYIILSPYIKLTVRLLIVISALTDSYKQK